jgi:hypothetical protein
VSLIVSETPIQWLSLTRRAATKAIILVGRTREDRYEPVRRFGMFSPYRLIFGVDVSDHHDDVQDHLPSDGDVFEFKLRLVLDWSVTNAVKVVARGIDDGLALCKDHLVDQMRDITRGFPIEASADAEAAIRRALGNGPVELPEGLTIHRLRPQLTVDEATRNAGHAITEAHSKGKTLDIQQKYELRRKEGALEAIQSAVRDYDPIAVHLAEHPDRTKDLVDTVQTNERESQDRRDALINALVRQELIQDIDVGDLTSSLLTNAAHAYQVSPQRNFGGPQVIQAVVTSHDEAAHDNGSSAPPQNGEPPPPDESGVAGWRPVPPRMTD